MQSSLKSSSRGSRDLISVADAARRIGVSLSSAYSFIHRQNDPLPAFDFGGSIRVDPDELEAWKARHRVGVDRVSA